MTDQEITTAFHKLHHLHSTSGEAVGQFAAIGAIRQVIFRPGSLIFAAYEQDAHEARDAVKLLGDPKATALMDELVNLTQRMIQREAALPPARPYSRELKTRQAGHIRSPGVAQDMIHVICDDFDDVPRYNIKPSQIPDEIGRFEAALIQTRMQILEMQQRIAESIGAKDPGLFDAHLLVVDDRTLIDEVLRKLDKDHCNVEWVFQEVTTSYSDALSKFDDPYLRDRALDVQDVTKRVIANLLGKDPKPFVALTERHILVAQPDENATAKSTGELNLAGVALYLGSGTLWNYLGRTVSRPDLHGKNRYALSQPKLMEWCKWNGVRGDEDIELLIDKVTQYLSTRCRR